MVKTPYWMLCYSIYMNSIDRQVDRNLPGLEPLTLSGVWQGWEYQIRLVGSNEVGRRVVGLELTKAAGEQFRDNLGNLLDSRDSEAVDLHLTTRAFRSFPLGEIIRDGLAIQQGKDSLLFEQLERLTKTLGGLPNNGRILLAATTYSSAIEKGSRKPTSETAKLLGLSTSAVHARLQRARDRGFLGEADLPGLPGGSLTAKGREAVEVLIQQLEQGQEKENDR
jgi:hypothetical protein